MPLQGRLTVIEGFLSPKEYPLPLEGDFIIGRHRRLNLPILARTISRKHAKISFRNGVYTITDLESKAGVIVNDRRVTMTVLRHGDRIQIGHVKFRFSMQEPQRPATTPLPAAVIREPIVIPPKLTPAPALAIEAEAKEAPAPLLTAEESAFIGRTIGGTKLISALARTRRALIFKGTQAAHNRVVALKLLRPEVAKDPDIVAWFIAGARRASQLSHENIVSPLGGGTENGHLFVYLPFLEYGSAQQRFSAAIEEGIPAAKRALETLVHVTRALEFAQGQDILHLGLRPSKILFYDQRRARVTGLGFDNTLSAPGARRTPEVQTYLAPEQLGAIGELTVETDIFSLGATFYYMLTGQAPQRDRRQGMPSPKQVNRIIPDSVCRIAEKMVAPDPEGRYRSYGQLLHDLRWALRGEAWPHA